MFFNVATGLAGGLALFLYGMHLIKSGLQKAAAGQVQYVLGRVTKNRFFGMLAGLVISLFLQSSGVTTVLLVGFVSARLMSLSQALGVILGATIGSTFTPQLIAFRIGDYAFWPMFIGLIPFLFSRRLRWRHLGEALIGFGLIFYGAGILGGAAVPLLSLPAFVGFSNYLSSHNLLMTVVMALFTALIQGSAASVVFIMALAEQGALPLTAALAAVLGANIGTTTVAFISSLSLSREAKRVALAHFLFRLGGVLIIFPFLGLYTSLAQATSGNIARQVANGHTLFNLITMMIFIWFTPWIGRLTEKILPDVPGEEKMAKYLDSSLLNIPELALAAASREIIRMTDIIRGEMFPRVMRPLSQREVELPEKLSGLDSILDYLYKAVAKYLSQLNQGNLTEEQQMRQTMLLYVANDLEHTGDVTVEMGHQWRKIEDSGIEFSAEGHAELQAMFAKVQDNFASAVESFVDDDENLAARVIRGHPEILRMEKNLRYSHFQRLQWEDSLSMETTSAHTDLINQLLRLNYHSVSIAQAVMGII